MTISQLISGAGGLTRWTSPN